MQIEYYGANCVVLSTKQARLVFDDNLAAHGLKTVTKKDDIAIYTTLNHENTNPRFIIDTPGEYEVSNISVTGIAAQSHIDTEGLNSIIYIVTISGVRVAVIGNIKDSLSDAQQEALGMIDILIVPVGGSGFTLDPIGAKKLIKVLSPKVFIPVHYADGKTQYEVPQVEIETVIKEMAIDAVEPIDTYKLKSRDSIEEATKVVILHNKS